MISARKRLALAQCCAGAAFLIVSSVASAAYNPVSSGSTRLVLAKSFTRLLSANQVRILPKGGAVRRGNALVLPASGGEFDPRLGLGTVETDASITLTTHRKLPIRRLTFKTKRSPLYAKVGGSQLKIATAAHLEYKRAGFGVSLAATGLRLTAKAASRFNKKLGLGRALEGGELLGAVKVSAQPATVHLQERGRLSLVLDPAFKDKLDKHFVSVNPIAPAELAAGPVLSFPIGLESTLATDASSGTIKLGGSVELLQLGNAQIFWREVWLQPALSHLAAETDVQPSPPRAGKQPQAPLFSLGAGASVSSDPASRAIRVSGQAASLTAATAAALNDAFAESKPVFAEGEQIGVLSFEAVGE